MTTAALNERPGATAAPGGALNAAARLWFAAAVTGQALFLVYILTVYGLTTLTGDFAAWNENKSLLKGYVPGDTVGNLAFAAHVLMAAVVTFGGTLQLVPQIRARTPAVHRWIGRAFMTTAILGSLVGIYMTWFRGIGEALGNSMAITLDGVLILAFAGLAWRAAVRREIASHRRWAMRTFIVANAVWFLRLGVTAYGVMRAPFGDAWPGMSAAFSVLNWACYLVPLAILELYFLARAQGGPKAQLAMAGGLTLATAVMSLGIFASWVGMFAPVIAKL